MSQQVISYSYNFIDLNYIIPKYVIITLELHNCLVELIDEYISLKVAINGVNNYCMNKYHLRYQILFIT